MSRSRAPGRSPPDDPATPHARLGRRSAGDRDRSAPAAVPRDGRPSPNPRGPVEGDRTVLFICVENACRSILAEALFNDGPPPGWRALSAGTQPAARAEPRVARMLEELGVRASPHVPTLLTPAMIAGSSRRITMGCLDHASCPARLREVELDDWALPDPAPLDDAGFRAVRDEIARKVRALVEELAASAGPPGRPAGRSPPA